MQMLERACSKRPDPRHQRILVRFAHRQVLGAEADVALLH